MSNPFKEDFIVDGDAHCYFSSAISAQLENKSIGDSFLLNIFDKDLGTTRMTINHCSKKLGFKFSTKTSGGDLWVKRVS